MSLTIAGSYQKGNSILHVPTESRLLSNPVMESKAIRRANMEALAKDKTLEELADAVGTSARLLSQIRNSTRNMGDRLARQFEKELRLPNGWMDSIHSGAPKPFSVISGGKPDKPSQVNTALMMRAVDEVNEAMRGEKKVYPLAKKAAIVEVVYGFLVTNGSVDADTIKSILRLVS